MLFVIFAIVVGGILAMIGQLLARTLLFRRPVPTLIGAALLAVAIVAAVVSQLLHG